jgi:hypothetical protein
MDGEAFLALLNERDKSRLRFQRSRSPMFDQGLDGYQRALYEEWQSLETAVAAEIAKERTSCGTP